MHGREDVVEGGALRGDAVVGDEAVLDESEADVKNTNAGFELDGEWSIDRLALCDRPAIESHAVRDE